MKPSHHWLFFIILILSACTSVPPAPPTQLHQPTKSPLILPPTWTPTPSETPSPIPSNTPIPTATPNLYSALSAELRFPGPATFHFTYVGEPTIFGIRISTDPTMASDRYENFAVGGTTPLIQGMPTQWDKYICGETLYWRVMTDEAINSPVQSTIVDCSYIADGEPGFWAKTYSGGVSFTVHSILDTKEGGLLITGTTLGPNDDPYDPVLVKLHPDGSIAWQKIFPTTFTLITLEETLEGHIFLTGTYDRITLTGSQVTNNSGLFFVVEITPEGEIVKQETYQVSGFPIGQIVQQADGTEEILPMNSRYTISPESSGNRMLEAAVMFSDGGAIMAGPHWGIVSGSDGGLYPARIGFWAFRVDQTGQVLWQKFFEGAAPPYMKGLATQDQGVVLSGKTYTGRMMTWIVKFDSEGNLVFWKFFTFDATGISETPDGGFLLWQRNFIPSSTGKEDYVFRVFKTNALGELVWARNYEGLEAEFLYERKSGGYVLTGMYNGVPMVITLDENGNLPECGLVHYVEGNVALEAPVLPQNVSGATTVASRNYGTPAEIDADPPLLISTTQLIAHALCHYTPPPATTPTPLPPTPQVTSIQSGQLYPILIGQEGYLLGGIQDGQWVDTQATSEMIAGDETYALYDSTGLYLGMAGGKNPLPTTLSTCESIPLDHISQSFVLALPGYWPLTPRAVTNQPPSQLYRDAAALFLQESGHAAENIQITHVMRLDFQGDGAEEVLLRVIWTENQEEHTLLLLRQLVGNTVITTPLITDTDPQPASHEVLAFADLNNDGTMEILARMLGGDVQHFRLWEIRNFTPELVLSVACPIP